jgi:hypothetical protein
MYLAHHQVHTNYPKFHFFNNSKKLGIESLHNNLVLLAELLVLIIVKTFFKIKY